ncbi:MAG: glycoside hydrolase N-terminal domain-containing protein [Firmicutes bacterium]|nr:glycoside hydrolase N-terminal domain-containing protein [Bacillota bacterium]
MARLSESTILYSKRPSSFFSNRWLDASITGNGKIGVAVTGAYVNEAILINNADLKTGGYTGVLQDVSDKFALVRKLYKDAKVLEAEKLLASEFAKKGYKPSPALPTPVGILNLDFSGIGAVTDYRRITNMESGEVTVEFRSGQTLFERNTFVGRSSDIVAYNVAKNGPDKISLRIGLDSGEVTNTTLKFEGGYIYFSARGSNNQDYGLVARIIAANAMVGCGADFIQINDADSVTIFAKTFVGGNKDAEFKNIKNELFNIKNTYDKMQSQNANAHKKLWDEVSLSLESGKDVGEYDMSSLIAKTHEGILSTEIIERLWNLSKYISICMGGNVVSTGGLWGGVIAVQENILSYDNAYQLAYGGLGLSVNPEAILSLLDFYEKYSQDLKKNAVRVYGAKGSFIPNATSPDSALFGNVDAKTLHFISSGALAANLIYNYYLATGDSKVLKSRILPFMKDVFAFYSDILKLDNDGYYSIIPSYSPNSTPGNTIGGKKLEDFGFAVNSTIDFLAIGTLLDNLIHASTALSAGSDIPIWQEMKRKIPQFNVNESGAIKEYTNSAFIDGVMNCGNMHCYGLYPLKTFSFNDIFVSYKPAVSSAVVNPTISLKEASANASVNRLNVAGSVQNSRAIAMSAVQLAHAGRDIKELLLKLVSSSFVDSGLCLTNDWRGSGITKNKQPSLDICGNLGFGTAITECIMQSNYNTLRILPVMFDEIMAGKVENISTDFAALASIDWDVRKGRLLVRILPKLNCKIDICFPKQFKKIRTKGIELDSDNFTRGVSLIAGKMMVIEF